ncbi:MAG: GLUG motif-containing protein [Phycisphaerae bacterium]
MTAGVQKRKIRWAIYLLLVILYFYSMPAQAQYGGGSGRAEDPYLIYTAEQMNAIGANTSDYYKHFKLMADIDMSSYIWTDFNIIGYHRNLVDRKSFAGVFDGNGHTISHLTIEGGSYLGLFGLLGGGEVKNLGLVDVNVTGLGDRIGGLVGENISGIITNCYTEGTITGNKWVGGLVGSNGGDVTNCCSSGVVSGEHYVGGLVGHEHRQIYDCYSTTNVSGRECVGGLVGLSWKGTITNCYSVGRVTGMTDVGGLIGLNYGNVYSSFWDIEASGQMTSAGGTGKTTAEMQDSKSLMDAGWDFVGAPDGPSDIWSEPAGGGYPILWWQLSPLPALPTFSGGTGTVYDPYLISIGSELNSIGYNPRLIGAHFNLIDDIDMTGIDFFIIGNWSSPFTGVFDGNGHVISNFTCISTDANRVALFGDVRGENAEIKDLRLIDPNVDAGQGNYVGSLVARLREGTITDCYAEGGNVAGNESVGALVGFNYDGDISNCCSTVSVSGFQFVGGLVGSHICPGSHHVARISNSYSVGSVTGTKCVGGLVGQNDANWGEGTITNCYSTSSVIGSEKVGGLVGVNTGSSWMSRGGISNSYATGNVSGDREVGGLVGFNQGTITNCYYMGSVSGDDFVGGLVGSSSGAGTNDCYITNCYSSGMIIGVSCVGGLVGINKRGGSFYIPSVWNGGLKTPMSRITKCYSTGHVTGYSKVGGLVGENDSIVNSSFWDIENSGQSRSNGGTGKTTAMMQMQSTFTVAGWDFVDETANGTKDIWWILEGQDYPRLWWQLSAFSSFPQDGAIDVTQPIILQWAPGRSALYHDIYFGEDEDAVKKATTGSPEYKGSRDLSSESYNPGKLALDTTYYWRINEVNNANPDSPWIGPVWSFTTANFLIVDDFESYNDLDPDDPESNRIFNAWIDGYDDPTNGSLVGYENAPFAEQTIVHGGSQSMPLFYGNSVGYSEATLTLTYPRDWTENGVSTLSI